MLLDIYGEDFKKLKNIQNENCDETNKSFTKLN